MRIINRQPIYNCWLFIVLIAASVACSKEEPSAPQVKFITPAENASFGYQSLIPIEATISSERELKKVTVSIRDEDMITAISGGSHDVEGNSVTFTRSVMHNNLHLETGTYYATLTVETDHDAYNYYQKVSLFEAPKKLKGLFIFTQSGAQSLEIYRYDSTLTFEDLTTKNMDFQEAAFNPRYQYLAIAGSQSGDLIALNPEFMTEEWFVPNTGNSGYDYFTSVKYDEKTKFTLVTISSREFFAYAGSQNPRLSATTDEFDQPTKSALLENLITLYTVDPPQGFHKLELYHKSTGTLLQSRFINMIPVFLHQKSGDTPLLFGNENGQAVIKQYQYSGDNMTTLTNIPGGEMHDAMHSGDYFYIAHDQGIYRYSHSNGGYTQVVSGACLKVWFDNAEERIFAIMANDPAQLVVYNDSGTLIQTIGVGSDIEDVALWFNK